MIGHTQDQLRELLRDANAFVANGERSLNVQEALVTKQDSEGRQSRESAKLLRNMREAQSLMKSHVRLLQSEMNDNSGSETEA
jgi:hypothetical protein